MAETMFSALNFVLFICFAVEVISFMMFIQPLFRVGITYRTQVINNVEFDIVKVLPLKGKVTGRVNDATKEVFFRRRYLTFWGLFFGYWFSPFIGIMKYSKDNNTYYLKHNIGRFSCYFFMFIIIVLLFIAASGVPADVIISSLLTILLIGVYLIAHYISFGNIANEILTNMQQTNRG